MKADAVDRTPAPLRLLAVFALLFVFLLGVKGLGDGFKLLGGGVLDLFFSATGNPLIGLLVGILGTTLVQSSSVSTSIIVGLVAAPENPLPLANAIPMVMGANIGTTVTNTIVALAHMGRRDEFRRAFAAATCHDFFNYFAVMIFLPLELTTGMLRHIAGFVASRMEGRGGIEYESPLKPLLHAGLAPVNAAGKALFESEHGRALFLIAVSAVFIFGALLLVVRLMQSLVQLRVEGYLTGTLGSSAVVSILVGTIVTVMVQSSSITTSLLVPLAGAGIITLEQAFPVTLGANIGTTITALLASLAVTGPNAVFGVEIALVHFLFNLFGTLIIYPVRAIRRLPLTAARLLAEAAARSRKTALAYVVFLFYLFPALLIFLNRIATR